MLPQVPIGVSDFREIIETRDSTGEPYLFVDKSLLIKDVIEDLTKVKLITRPRRFGKTLNMSMLHHFFAKTVHNKPTEHLFKGLKIAEYAECMKHQGQYPIIFLSLKDIKSASFKSAYEDFCKLLSQAYEQHEHLLSDSKLTQRQKNQYNGILNRDAPESDIRSALKDLTFYLYQGYGVKPIVLIDEYDTPIQTAYVKNYYEEMVTLMREFLGAGLKDNSHLDRAILTGVLRVSKESIFSGLNNIKTYSVLNDRYGEYFGFVEDEVSRLLIKTALDSHINDVKAWYNGYQIGDAIIYNPWSIVNYIQERGKLSSYWVNTSDNALIKDLWVHSSELFKGQFELLLKDEQIIMLMDEHLALNNLDKSEIAIWTLLAMSGYLKANFIKNGNNESLYYLKIPNKEVKDLYKRLIAEWLSGVNNAMVFNTFLNNLLNGEMKDFEDGLRRILLQTFSAHDIKGKNSEKFYHGFMLGLLSGIDQNHYKIDSNKESGLGRYDIILIPNDTSKLGIILEIKSIDESSSKNLKEAANEAIKQIDEKQYHITLLQHSIKHFLKIGVAFKGKELVMDYKIDA
ncbi:MAG TPA: AAA family ATPase [Gammaproteobacteria bacterium]|nr:AAA family ATPase [Gammaproteobacteria bacterium]